MKEEDDDNDEADEHIIFQQSKHKQKKHKPFREETSQQAEGRNPRVVNFELDKIKIPPVRHKCSKLAGSSVKDKQLSVYVEGVLRYD